MTVALCLQVGCSLAVNNERENSFGIHRCLQSWGGNFRFMQPFDDGVMPGGRQGIPGASWTIRFAVVINLDDLSVTQEASQGGIDLTGQNWFVAGEELIVEFFNS